MNQFYPVLTYLDSIFLFPPTLVFNRNGLGYYLDPGKLFMLPLFEMYGSLDRRGMLVFSWFETLPILLSPFV